MSNDDDKNEKAKREIARAFKEGWDKSGRDGFVSPQLQKALVEQGIHPDRTQEYMEALQEFRASKTTKKPDPQDFTTPKIIPFKPNDDGPKGGGGGSIGGGGNSAPGPNSGPYFL